MTEYPIDIILPVWNRPIDVRAALAAFVSDSPMARLVMVNIGSERETESILDEFAEALDDRALLVASAKNIGSVAAYNLGLSRAISPLVLIATSFTRLKAGWFPAVAAFFDRHHDAGAVILREHSGSATPDPIEADHGSFDAMIIRSSLYNAVGGFDESMDGGEWALRDFARRSLAIGYKTFSLRSSCLKLLAYSELGSVARREDRVRLGRECYVSRWSEPETFLLNCSESLFGSDIEILKTALLQSARQGNRLIVTADSKIVKMLLSYGFSTVHENVVFKPLPRFFSEKALRKTVEAVACCSHPAIISESEIPECHIKRLSFHDFLLQLQERTELYYQRGNS